MSKPTLELDEEIITVIKIASREEGRSVDEIVQEAMEEYLRRRRGRVPAIFGTWSGGTIGAVNTEDWLSKNWNPA